MSACLRQLALCLLLCAGWVLPVQAAPGEIAVAALPHAVPPGFHGCFVGR